MTRLRTANLLGAIAIAIVEHAERGAKHHPNETSSALAALNVIAFYDGCSNKTLSLGLGLSHTATVRLVDKLERSGLVRREVGADRRSVVLSLTEQGQQRAKHAMRDRSERLATLVDALAPEQQRQLDAIAATLLHAMVGSAADADHLCRLCDDAQCPLEQCPVHLKLSALDPAR